MTKMLGKCMGVLALGLCLLWQVPSAAADDLTALARDHRTRMALADGRFSGPALDRLLAEAREAQFLLIGEEHGIAENPQLAAQLFETLTGDGYEHVAIEISPPMADEIDRVLSEGGLDGLRDLFALPGGEPAFFGMKEEAEFLARVRGAREGGSAVLWGADYEVAADRHLLRVLAAMDKPDAAQGAFETLKAASDAAWAKYDETGNPGFIFSFSGDPALVRALAAAWPERSERATSILHTLEETLEVNRLWVAGKGWHSNERRADLLRHNFLTHWRAEQAAGRSPKVLAKFGASHMIRGLTTNRTFDLGALLHEIAALEGRTALSVLVLPGPASQVAVLDPVSWTYRAAPAKDGYARGLEPILAAAYDDGFTLIDLRALRPSISAFSSNSEDAVRRIVHGFDMVLIMTGSTPSAEFDHPEAAD